MPPSSGEPWIWLISVRPRSRWCSMAKRQPFGRTLIDRPDGAAMRRRPRSPSRGVSKVRMASSVLSRGRVRTPAERYLAGKASPDSLFGESGPSELCRWGCIGRRGLDGGPARCVSAGRPSRRRRCRSTAPPPPSAARPPPTRSATRSTASTRRRSPSEIHDHDDGSGRWDVGGLFDGAPGRGRRSPCSRRPTARPTSRWRGSRTGTGWRRSSAELTPVEAGRFVVYGSHDRGAHRAATASASRSRRRRPSAPATTRRRKAASSRSTGWCGAGLVRAARRRHRRRHRRPRDGGGLGLAGTAVAGDIDPLATRTARANVAANGLADRVACVTGGGLPPPAAARGARPTASSSRTSSPGR